MQQKKRGIHLLRGILLSLNIVAILALVFSLVSSVIPPSVFPYLSIFGLLYPILLLVNLAFVLIWIVLKNKLFLLSLMAVLLGYQNLADNLQLFSGQESIEDTRAINVFTHNVKVFGAMDNNTGKLVDFEKARTYIQASEAGVVCLQEYFSNGITRYGPLEQLKQSLGARNYYFESYIEPRGNRVNGIVTFSRYPIVGTQKFKFPVWRTFGIATDILVDHDTIRVFNIHLASIALNPDDIDFVVNAGQDDKAFSSHAFLIYSKLYEAFLLRERQVDYITRQLQDCPYPVILAGDFNDTPSSYVYAQMTSWLDDTFIEKGKGLSITFAGQIPFLRIDYIMKSHHFKTLQYNRHKVDFSDHYPVSASMILE